MVLDERAWLRDRLREQIVSSTKALAELRAFLSTHPDDKHAQEHFIPYIEDHKRIIENCQAALARQLPPRKLWLCFPLEWGDRKGRLMAPPSLKPSCDVITSLTLNVYGLDSSSQDWRNSFPSFRCLKHLTLITVNPQALSIAKHCLKTCPRLGFLTLLWPFVLDWQHLGPEDGYFTELEDMLGCSLGKLKKLELDWIIYKRLAQKCDDDGDIRKAGTSIL
jgi:hypothetical protein